MKHNRAGTCRWAAVVLTILCVAAICATAAFSQVATGSSPATQTAGSPVWTPADIAKVAKANGVAPFSLVYAVPKNTKHYKLAFIHLNQNNPYMIAWAQGMKAAAKFYGLSLILADAQDKLDTETDLYDTLNAQHPDAVGAHPGNAVIAQKAAANHQPFITIDGYGTGGLGRRIGVPDKKVGEVAGKLVADQAQALLKGAWKGKQVYYIGLGVPGCPPCETRVHVAYDTSKSMVKYAGSAFITEYATPDVGQKFMVDQMTAHPNGVFVIVPLGDESLIGVLQALKNAGRLNSAIAVTVGGSVTGRGFLRTYPKTVFAGIDFNPFGEAWNWVAASIAALQNHRYSEYNPTTILTPQNINQYYPNDKK
jgi:ABC-type sugar transport system substrate-binding protein